MFFKNEDHNFFLLINKNMNKELFVKKAGVKKGSFAESIITRIYDTLTIESVDVLEEFNNYYSKEYLDLKEFLYKKYNLSKKIIKLILEKFDSKKILLYGDLMNLGGFSVLELINSRKLEEVIDKITN